MAIIVGGSSGASADVDATPKASRVILYGADGTPMQPSPSWSGVYPVVVKQSTAAVAGQIVWGLYNSSATKTVSITSLDFWMYFDGTAAATLMKYEMVKYTGVTSFSGGAVVVPMHKRSTLSGAVVSVARVLDTGLTQGGGTAQGAVQLGAQGRVTQTTTNFNVNRYNPMVGDERGVLNGMSIELAQNELLALRQVVVSVIGDNLVGFVEVTEY